jgi:hypothetical protein
MLQQKIYTADLICCIGVFKLAYKAISSRGMAGSRPFIPGVLDLWLSELHRLLTWKVQAIRRSRQI